MDLDSKIRQRDSNRDKIMEDQYLVKHLTEAKEKKKVYKKSASQ